jgi:tetratricopeptide (TPR) repeat protein
VNFLGLIASISLLVSIQVQADTNDARDYIEAFAGDIPEMQSSPAVREAAREYILGKQFASEGKHGFAITHFKKSIEFDNISAAPWVGLAVSLSEIGNDENIIDAWRGVLHRDPAHGDALLVVGLASARLGNFESALLYLSRKWLQQDDASVEALLRDAALNSVLRQMNYFEASTALMDVFQQTFDDGVTTLIANNDRGAWLGVLQQLVDVGAAKIASQVVAAGSPHVEVKELGSLLTVLPLLEAASNSDGSLTEQVYATLAKSNGLLPLAPEWDEPVSHAEALSTAAQTMSLAGAIDGAINLNSASLVLSPENALTANNLAWMKLIRDGATDEVVALCMYAYELAPEEPYIMDTVGWMYALHGEPEKAIPLLVSALRNSRQPSPEIYDHLGDAYWMAGNFDNALRAWQTATSLLNTTESRQAYLEGYSSMVRSVWGISVATPEAMYDLELGEMARNVLKKLAAVKNGEEPEIAAPSSKIGD